MILSRSFHQLSNFWVSLISAYFQQLVFVFSLQRYVVSRKVFNYFKTDSVFLQFKLIPHFWVSLISAYLQHSVFLFSLQRYVVSLKCLIVLILIQFFFFSLSRYLIVSFYPLSRPNGDRTTFLSGLYKSKKIFLVDLRFELS